MSQRTVEIDDKKVGERGKISLKRRLNSHAVVCSNNNRNADRFNKRPSSLFTSLCNLQDSKMRLFNNNRSRTSRFTDDLSSTSNNNTTRFVPSKNILTRYHNNNMSSRPGILHRGEKGIHTRHFMQQIRQNRNNNANKNQHSLVQNRHFSPVSPLSITTASSSTSSLPDESALEGDISPNAKNKVEFLETYITTLKNQILYKDKKLHRLQREHPIFSADNKDTLLQNSWDRHDEMYRKFKTLEADKKLLVENNEKLENTVKELQTLNENQSKEKEVAEQTIQTLQGELSQLESVKLENQVLKQHYEQELHKKLQAYQLECFEYVQKAIIPYQMKLQAAQMQILQMIEAKPIDPQNILPYSNGFCPQSSSLGILVSDSANNTMSSSLSSAMTVSRIFDDGFFTKNNNLGPGESTSSSSDQISSTKLKLLSDMILNHQ